VKILLSCGEPSGDLYAGALVRALRRADPSVEVFGMGGAHMAEAGAELLVDYRGLAVTGLTEVVTALPRLLRTLRTLVDAARDRRPDVLVVIDYPDFNFRLMQAVKALGIPVVYYISPQLWAWRAGRMRTMQAVVDRVLPIFPFEEALYREAGVDVRFVGHPLLELTKTTAPREALRAEWGIGPDQALVALLPGSRGNELKALAPVLAEARDRIRQQRPSARFVVARAPHVTDAWLAPLTADPGTLVVADRTDDVLAACDVVLTASGTATVQAAIHGAPMVVLYRLSALTYRLFKPLGRVDMYAMVNLISGRRIVRELIQDECRAEAAADEALRLLTDRDYRAQMVRDLAAVREALGGPGASDRAAAAIAELVTARATARG
jgi:lipid-A-disaccharide synthase